MKMIDITGQRFGRLTVVERVENYKTAAMWRCICDCGRSSTVIGRCLRSGHTKSCGCLSAETSANTHLIHGQSTRRNETEEYRIWLGMKNRCENKNNSAWKNYGGRGIKVCNRWFNFENFFADMKKRPSQKYSIERINVNGDYEPDNCKWATDDEQARNTRLNKRNKTGIRGVSYCTKLEKYRVNISIDRKQMQIGLTSSLEEAKLMREEAELKYWGKSS